jgi:hypothetical protein
MNMTQTSKTIPVTGRGGLWSSEMLRIVHCPDNRLTDGGWVVSLTRRPRFTGRNHSELISVTGWVNPWAMVRLEGLGALKNINDPIGSRISDLPACSTAPQTSMLQLILELTNTTINNKLNILYTNWPPLCLVVRVIGYRSGGPGSIPGTTKKSSGSGTGSTQPREYNWGATW